MTELDVKNGIRTLASKATPPHDEQAFMDEYYKGTGKSSDVAIGALGLMTLGVPFIRAQKVANTLQTQKNISRYVKENILKNRNPDKVTFANLIEQGFFKNPAKVAAEFEKQIGRLGKGGMGLAGTAWLSKFGPQDTPEHDEQALMDEYYSQKKSNGGSIYEAEKSYDYDPALWKTSALPMLKGLASLFLPQDAADVALMTTPLWWMKSLKTGSQAYKKAEKLQKKVDREKFDYNREMKNAPYDRDPAYQAAWGHQQNIIRYNDQIKKIIRKGGNPTGGKGISSATGKKYGGDTPKEMIDHYILRQQGYNPPSDKRQQLVIHLGEELKRTEKAGGKTDDLLRTIVDIVTPD